MESEKIKVDYVRLETHQQLHQYFLDGNYTRTKDKYKNLSLFVIGVDSDIDKLRTKIEALIDSANIDTDVIGS